jgi:RimK family alpha-L-glutamate ligase
MNGWLIYDEAGAKRNEWFIGECIRAAADEGLHLTLKLAGEISFEEELPNFALVRTIAPILSVSLESAGVRVYNHAIVSTVANNKWLTYRLGNALGLPVLPTQQLSAAKEDAPFGYPAVVKSVDGHGGAEVYRFFSKEEYAAFSSANACERFIVQPCSDEVGKDLRAYVLDGKILACVLRTSDSDFRSNFSLGGNVQLVPAPAEIQKMVQILHANLRLDFVGVDFIRDGGAWVLNEIEDSVGCRMLYKTSGIDVAKEYLRHVAKRERMG